MEETPNKEIYIEKPNNKGVQEFQQIYRQKYGKDISDDKARELTHNLLTLYKAVYMNNIRPNIIDSDDKKEK